MARRWWFLFPGRRDAENNPEKPTEMELRMLMADSEALEERRRRLSSLSWFMRCLAERIAREANREDKCSGRFWNRPSYCTPILDSTKLRLKERLACAA